MNKEYGYSDVQSTISPLTKVFGWMGLALALTALTSFSVFYALVSGLISPELFSGLLIGSFVVYLGSYFYVIFSRIRYGQGNALIPFVLFAASFGVMLSTLPFAYSIELIGSAFLISSFVFGAFALYGATTKSNLMGLGQFAITALFGAILLMIVNIFLRSNSLDWILSFVIFGAVLLIVSYQVWMVKQIAQSGEMTRNQAIIAALGLYVSFMNIFLRILRFMAYARRR